LLQSNVPVSDQIWTVDGREVVEGEKTLEQLGWPEEVIVSFSRRQRSVRVDLVSLCYRIGDKLDGSGQRGEERKDRKEGQEGRRDVSSS